MPVYRRACRSRTMTLVVALLPMADSAHALAREFRVQAEDSGVKIVTDFDRKPFEAAVAGVDANAEHDPAAAALIERIRKVE
ncbi:hypothetical protein MTX26_33325 [Bradyrhizobium sp. ISRA443]|uniref:hypothetical protein n=1 Tax=unclassified Bradyrhizobium TaxID=2631580 RepID=UPI00247AD2EC|nr:MULTISPECIES: hypothetical protein [unclassified Bradyrhizobium]WGR99016.1 hypothetical protein MTX23_33305 [Bradyrhizobium sp. ISRA436]WGS05907.1 hypothetical protein MTX18_33325 [Bradyrhizobium sp. ISRA437]WGS12793.1 hypothetical protein MTX26_33325 [Bradyrhizobium sp. ISRA443]